MPEFKLVSFSLCPYVQRAHTLLLEKHIKHEIVYVNLDNPPAWFIRVSPLHKVPLLMIGNDKVLFESLAICEYLDEITPGTLHPEDSFEKALNRAWIEFGNDILLLTFQYFTTKDHDLFNNCRKLIRSRFDVLEKSLTRGPFFNGDKFYIIDMVYAPIFRFHHAIMSYNENIFLSETEKLNKWAEELFNRESVQKSVPENYYADLIEYLKKQRSLLTEIIG